MDFRAKLLGTLRAVQPILEVPGVLVVGSDVPNLLEPNAASTLVVSQDVDLGVPVEVHADVKRRLAQIRGLRPSSDEPSVWTPEREGLIEVNFLGIDRKLQDPSEAYVLSDPELPLLVFGGLSYLSAREPVVVDELMIPVPRPAGLLLEKLVSDRTGVKGERDLLVVLGLLLVATDADLDELGRLFFELSPELQHAVRSNLTLLSLARPHSQMPDPSAHRSRVTELLARLGTEAET